MSTCTHENYRIYKTSVRTFPAIRLTGLADFDISQIFDCGQCFRFMPLGNDPYHIGGVAFGRYIELVQKGDELLIINSDIDDFENIWKRFLSLDVDYADIKKQLVDAFEKQGDDRVFAEAVKLGGGIRLLRQDKWECLCSFIISQNNNIPRIRKIIGAMCEKYGEPVEFDSKIHYSFPTAEALLNAGVDGIFALGTGFRAKYIYDAARALVSGEIDLEALAKIDTADAEHKLCKIKGVGPKVAACALLFSLEKYDAFPIDVWVKRILDKYFKSGLDIPALGRYAGIAQQYLFYYERYTVGK